MAYHHVISYAWAHGTDSDINHLPHDGVPPCGEGISDQCYGIYRPDARISHKYAVTDYDDQKKRKRVQRSRYPAAVCHYTCNGNKKEPASSNREIEKLSFSNAPEGLSAFVPFLFFFFFFP